jgi:hypothetical protein
VDPVPDPLLRKSGSAGNRTRTSGSVARNHRRPQETKKKKKPQKVTIADGPPDIRTQHFQISSVGHYRYADRSGRFFLYRPNSYIGNHSGRPRGLRHELSSPARPLGSWVRIPLKTWLSVCVR